MLDKKIGVIGLGYVGLPLAALLATKYAVVGYDIKKERVQSLKKGMDKTDELSKEQLNGVLQEERGNIGLWLSAEENDLADCDFYIVTVPTPIDKFSRPDLRPLEKASQLVAQYLKKGDYVVYESTVYPGVTEEVCVPILERNAGLILNKDFFVGYSPERINPGDKLRTVAKILKITSGSTPEAANVIDAVYRAVISAGTFKASSIKVAESAKVIENAQRDVNIAFVNELAKIFAVLGIDTQEVLAAAGTKWNFLPFQPGLVGGHCIGVDPFYLAEKAKIHGYHPELLLASRRLNDSMGGFVAEQVIKGMIKKDIAVKNSKVLLLGLAFKENCHDVRNSKVLDIYNCLIDYDCQVTVCDGWVDQQEVREVYGLELIKQVPEGAIYDAVVLAVAHDEFKILDLATLLAPKSFVYDVKGFWTNGVDQRL